MSTELKNSQTLAALSSVNVVALWEMAEMLGGAVTQIADETDRQTFTVLAAAMETLARTHPADWKPK